MINPIQEAPTIALPTPHSMDRDEVATERNDQDAGAPCELTEKQRYLVAEAMTAQLDYVHHDMFESAGAEQELFNDSTDLSDISASWCQPALNRNKIATSTPRSLRLTTAQEKHVF